jgi:hypothetical protein
MDSKKLALRTKILKGIELSFLKLLEKKRKENGELVYCKDGQIIRIKAIDLIK